MMASPEKFTKTKIKNFLVRLNSEKIDHNFKESSTNIFNQPLSFAAGWARIDCENHTDIPYHKGIFLADDNKIIPLGYTPDPYTNIFKYLPVNISIANVMQYLELYFLSLRNGGENLVLVSTIEDIEWQDDLSPALQKSLDHDFKRYPQISKCEKDVKAVFTCTFKDALMAVTCTVSKDGFVTIIDRELLTDSLPIKNFP